MWLLKNLPEGFDSILTGHDLFTGYSFDGLLTPDWDKGNCQEFHFKETVSFSNSIEYFDSKAPESNDFIGLNYYSRFFVKFDPFVGRTLNLFDSNFFFRLSSIKLSTFEFFSD